MRYTLSAACLVAMALAPRVASAQAIGAGIVTVNFGAQLGTTGLSESISVQKYIESAPISATTDDKGLPFLDLGVGFRVAGPIGAYVSFSHLASDSSAAVSAEIPHLFYLNQRRPIAGEVSSVHRSETAFHANAAYFAGTSSLALVLSGGASFFNTSQDFVTDVTFNEAYPFDTATFSSATLERGKEAKVGFNVAGDIAFKLGASWGVGGLVRYSRAEVPFTVNNIDVGSVRVGGLQAAGGLRIFF